MNSRHASSGRWCFPGWGLALLAWSAAVGCSGPLAPDVAREGDEIRLTLKGVEQLDPEVEGRYHAWIRDSGGELHPAGFLDGGSTGTIRSPVADGRGVVITVEPPGVGEASAASPRLLHGSFRNGRTELTIRGAVTQGDLELREDPGQFTIFAPSTGPFYGYPHHEECGVWLFNTQPRQTQQNDMWVRLSPVRSGWTYEIWVVRDLGSPGEIWLSGGKFRPSQMGVVDSRDDTGWGPFSGVAGFEVAGSEAFPGADWFSNPLDLPFPEELTLPLDLTEQTEDGEGRWHFVITIEPAFDVGEPLTTERPFVIRPYREPVGTAGPGIPRTLKLGREVPAGEARIL